MCSQCICVTWSQRLRRLARVPETLQKLLAVGHQSDASAHWGVGLAAGRSLCAVSVGLHCSFADSMARQRASRGERVAETSQLGDSRGACPNFLGGWQCIAYDLDFCMHVSACFCVGTASWLAFGPQLRAELRASLSTWARRTSFPPPDAPYDDFAIHLRCGDTLALGASCVEFEQLPSVAPTYFTLYSC